MKKISLLIILVCIFLQGCVVPPPQAETPSRGYTLGALQEKIKKGSSSAEVIDAIGSPNIVTSNKDNTETWVYDKVSTTSEAVSGYNAISTSKTSRTLLITIKFDKNKLVENVNFRQTSY
jgi:outer membrane protein assembly factor BamE (lipoprotein component of BamABCDE complex)